jgi:hypothetical protein
MRTVDPLLADKRMAELVRKGLVTPATLRPGGLPPAQTVTTFEELMRELGGP